MYRRPLDVVHVIAVVLERMQRPVLLHVPQLHRPIKRRREEVGRELDLPRHRVTIDAGHRSLVPLEHVGDAGLAAVTTGGIDGAFLAADDEVVDVVREERERRDGDWLRLLVLELHAVLGLRQHVEAPRTHLAVRRHADQVVRVLRADDVHAVHGVCVRGRRQRRALDGRALVAAIVPQHDLPRVGAADDQVRVELGEARRHDGRLNETRKVVYTHPRQYDHSGNKCLVFLCHPYM